MFAKKFDVFWDVFINHGGLNTVLEGLKNTLLIAVIGLLIGIVIGTLLATIRVLPKNNIIVKILDKIAVFYVSIFRGTPMVVQLLIFYYGAYISEIMRAGIMSVDPGQMEGGRAVGLSYGTTMMKIIIPQAVKNILPTLGNEFITLIKETSIVSFIGAMDLYVAFQNIGNNNYEYMIPYLFMAIIYIVLVVIISLIIRIMERSLRKSDKSL